MSRRKPTREELYAAKYTRMALEAFNQRPIGAKSNHMARWWWAYALAVLIPSLIGAMQ